MRAHLFRERTGFHGGPPAIAKLACGMMLLIILGRISGFPKIRGTFFGVLIIRTIVFGVYIGVP